MENFLSIHKKKKRIFIFDRNTEFIEALSLYFSDTHDIYGYTSVEEINKVTSIRPDIIVVDIFPLMHAKDIANLIRSIKNIYKRIPIILTSTSKKVFHKAKSVGIEDFLEKPFDIDLLQEKIYTLGK